MSVSPACRIVLLAALASLPAAASTTGLPDPDDRAPGQGATLVTVDFRVLARDGRPVLDLDPADIVLKVGGKPREIVALEVVKAGGDTPSATAGTAPAPPPPYLTNAPFVGGRSVMLLVDDEAIEPGQEGPVRDALSQLVAALTPGDQVGVATVRGGVVSHPTVRHDRVLKDIAALTGREGIDVGTSLAVRSGATPGTIPGGDATCRSRMVHDALMNLFDSAVPSVPTVVVLVSNALAAPSTFQLTTMQTGSGQTGACEFTSGHLDALTTAATLSRVHVYGLEIFRGADVAGGFENFANLTGNARVRLSGDTKPAMTRIANETLAYYVAAFEIADQERTGATQRVAVSVSRPGVEVKAQPTVLFAKPAAPGARVVKPKMRDMLGAAKTYRDVPLRAVAYTSRMIQQGKLSVVCAFDSDDPAVKIAEASVILFDTTGKARAQWTGQPAAFKARPVVAVLTAPGPGTYRLRLAVIDATGAAGTINEDVRIEALNPGTAQVSPLVLGAQGATGFGPRLEFVDEKMAMAVVEIAGVTKASEVAVRFEFAASEDSPPAATVPAMIQAPRDDLRIALVVVPVTQMPAGDFVVRAVVTVGGQELPARPVHTLRKVVR